MSVVRWFWAGTHGSNFEGLDPSSAMELLCELGQVTQPLCAFFLSTNGINSSSSLLALKELNKPNTWETLKMFLAQSEVFDEA